MLRTALTFAAIGCVALVTIATAQQKAQEKPQAAPNNSQPRDARTVQLTFRMIEENGDVTKVLANPTIRAIDGRPFAFNVGGVVEGTSPELEYGTRVEGTVASTETKAFAAALKLTQGQLVNSNDPKTKAVRAQTLDIRTELELSVTRTIQIDDKTSIEVTLEESAKL